MRKIKAIAVRAVSVIEYRWIEWIVLFLFVAVTLVSLLAPSTSSYFGHTRFQAAFNAALSIGTSGIVSFIFYYAINERLERKRQRRSRNSALRAYSDAKRQIAIAILHASQKGGRANLHADFETITKCLTVDGFRELFEGGREADEGFYAFQNQMSDRTFEYDEIIFNLKIISRAVERLIDNNHITNDDNVDFFVRLDTLIRRIERNGVGYDESKALCSFIWKIFSGWNFVTGYSGHDPIEREISRS